MQFNPITKNIYTDKNEFIKTMYCPYKIQWEHLEIKDSISRKCTNCNHIIIDTEGITDDELMSTIRKNPNTCFKVNLNQNNIKIINHDF
jgi:hypothetical protein